MNTYPTLSRRGFLRLASAAGVSMHLPLLSFAGTSDSEVAGSIGKFENHMLDHLVNGLPQSSRGQLQDFVNHRGNYIQALIAGTATKDTFVQEAAIPFAKMVNNTLAAAAVSDRSSELGKPAPQRFITQQADGSIIIPAQSTCTYAVSGLCMDRALPAPVKGDAQILVEADQHVPAPLLPLMRAVAASSGTDSASKSRAQAMAWALMAAGKPAGDSVSAQTLKNLDALVPGGAKAFEDYHKAKRPSSSADARAAATKDTESEVARIEAEVRRLQDAGERMDNGKGYGYSMVHDGAIAARATGKAPLVAQVELINDTYDDQAFRPGAYNTKALAEKQRAFPRPSDSAEPYGIGGLTASAGPFNVDRAGAVAKGLVFMGEQVIFEGSNFDKHTRGSRQVMADLSRLRSGPVSKAIVQTVRDSPQAQNLLFVAQAATGSHWSQV